MIQISTKQKMWLILSLVFFVGFVIFTLLVKFVDVGQVGLEHVNQFFLQHCGRQIFWEQVTDWIGYFVVLSMVGIVAWQIVQWVQRKSLRRIDQNLIMFDIIVVCLVLVYIFFELVVVNCRPELDNGVAKASYPSSHVMLFVTVLPMLIWQMWHYLKNKSLRIVLTVILSICLIVGIIGRMLSGVHWFTDIVGGIMISCCLICGYMVFVKTNVEN